MFDFKEYLLFWVISIGGYDLALNVGLSSANEIKACIKASDLDCLLLVSEFLGVDTLFCNPHLTSHGG